MKECSAFFDSIQQLEDYESIKNKTQQKIKDEEMELSKAVQGKKTLKSILSTGSKDERVVKLEKSIKEVTKENYFFKKRFLILLKN